MPFWAKLAPQLGQRHAAVRYGLTALGALQAPMHNTPVDNLQSRPRYDISPLAMSQMQKSIHIIRTADPASLPVEVFLTCCLLFLAQQFWIEKTSSAPTHALAANRIVQESLRREKGQALPREFADIFIPSLNELINQMCAFADDFPPAESGLPADYQLDFDVKQLGSVSDKTTAVDAIDRLLKCVIRATAGPRMPQTLKRKIPLAFEILDDKLEELHLANVLPRNGYHWLHLHLHLQVAKAMFQALGSNNELVFDDLEADFSFMVAACRKLVRLDIENPPSKTLNAHLGVLPPLFFAATRCRQSSVRRKALNLLHDARVSERGWTSCMAFTIAKFVVEQEEEVLNGLTEGAETAAHIIRRIRLYNIELSTEQHRAIITYDVFSPETLDGDGSRGSITCFSVNRRTSSITYPSHPVIEIDGATCSLPRKVLRACGYSSILLFRPRVECHCSPRVSFEVLGTEASLKLLREVDASALKRQGSSGLKEERGWCSRHL